MRSRSVVWTPKWVSWAARVMPPLSGPSRTAATKKAPRATAAPSSLEEAGQLGRQRRLGRLDGDRTGLLLLRDLALQLDRQQAVGKLRPDDLHVVGELEAALEVTAGDAAIEILLVVLAVLRGLAGDQELVLLLGHVQLGLGEARHRHHDLVGVVARLFDVVRRVAVGAGLAGHRIEQVEDPVEADGGAIERGIVKG